MQIGIISDAHDNWPTLDRVCAYMVDEGVQTLIHCGDVCAPLTLGHLLDQYDGEVHLVLGNVDGDPLLMATRFTDRKTLHHYGAERAELTLRLRGAVWRFSTTPSWPVGWPLRVPAMLSFTATGLQPDLLSPNNIVRGVVKDLREQVRYFL